MLALLDDFRKFDCLLAEALALPKLSAKRRSAQAGAEEYKYPTVILA